MAAKQNELLCLTCLVGNYIRDKICWNDVNIMQSRVEMKKYIHLVEYELTQSWILLNTSIFKKMYGILHQIYHFMYETPLQCIIKIKYLYLEKILID